VKKVLSQSDKGGIHAHALAIPMAYNESDIDVINELHTSVSKFRILLKKTIDLWNKEIEF
jgi:hypothetical protein